MPRRVPKDVVSIIVEFPGLPPARLKPEMGLPFMSVKPGTVVKLNCWPGELGIWKSEYDAFNNKLTRLVSSMRYDR